MIMNKILQIKEQSKNGMNKLIETSLGIAVKAYRGKVDKAGKEYILHPLRVMSKMTTDYEQATAILHDVIDDSDFTKEDLSKAGIPPEVVEAVVCISKKKGESYEDYIKRVAQNKIARKVKIADIEDNIDVLRLDTIIDEDLKRIKKYHTAHKYLTSSPSHA